MRFFGRIIEGPKFADFIKTPDTVEGIKILGVAGGELASFEIAAAQILIAEGIGTLPAEKMKTQPAAIGARNALGFAKESDNKRRTRYVSISPCSPRPRANPSEAIRRRPC